MNRYDAKTSLKGQATIPVEIRRLLGLEPGGSVQFIADAVGDVRVVAKQRNLKRLKGLFSRPPRPVSVEESIAETVARRNARGRKAHDP